MRIDSSGRLLIGHSTARTSVGQIGDPQIQHEGLTSDNSSVSIIRNSASNFAASLIFGKSRGTSVGSNTIVNDGDQLGTIRFAAADGTNIDSEAAFIQGRINGTPGSNDTPGKLFFATTADGADSATERMVIDSSGNMGIGVTSPDKILHVSHVSAPTLRLENTDTSLSSGQVVGNVEFEANDPSGIGVGVVGSIECFSDSSVGGSYGLKFKASTSSSGNYEAMRIAQNGFVGIGGQNPDTALHIEKLTPELRVQSTNTNLGQGSTVCTFSHHTSDPTTPTGVGEVFRIKSYSANGNGADYTTEFVSRAGSGGGESRIALGQGAVGAITFSTHASGSATERMRIDQDGRVIVGSSTHIGGAQFVVMGGNINTYGAMAIGNKVTNPTASTSIAQFRFNSGASGTRRGAEIVVQADGNWTDGSSHPSRMFFSTVDTNATGATERMRIHSNGSISVGVNQNNGIFCVSEPTATHAKSARFKASTSSGLSNTTALYIDIHGFYSNNYNAFGVTFLNGDDGAGTARTAKAIQFANVSGSEVGSIQQNQTSTSFNTSSDYRLKENATAISDGITRLKTLKPYRFNFKGQTQVVDGFFAHEVTAVPEAITGVKDEMQPETRYEEGDTIPSGKVVGDAKTYSSTEMKLQSIDQSKLVPLLTAALQEAITKIETLETKVAALESA